MEFARKGDIIVIFYEKLEPVLSLLREARQAASDAKETGNGDNSDICVNIG